MHPIRSKHERVTPATCGASRAQARTVRISLEEVGHDDSSRTRRHVAAAPTPRSTPRRAFWLATAATRCAPTPRISRRSSAGAPSAPSSLWRPSARILELYLRWVEQRGLAPATISRRFTTVAGFYRYAVIDGHRDKDPSLAVTRPRVPWEGQRRTVLHPLEYAALLTAARRDGPGSHVLVALLGMIGLRVSEATNINVTDLRSQSGYELLIIIGKGAKPALIPLPVPVLRAVRDAAEGRSAGPLLLNRHGERLSPAGAAWPRSPASLSTRARTPCAGRSAPRDWSAAFPFAICSTRCGTPTPGPPCATTWRERTWTGTQLTPWRPISPA